ncbi:amidohydrolase [Thermoclostridium stercorarium subsp. thermolacticum DSM 2910]|jgi:predicted TIM-barrel fold metal-dependent hydrolase|uniref:Amidohydrolase n=2 Tax=Thermoclostridium stercorarium TaxID=1510 RepID=A0A1B1YHQ7_THEST|nr:amidohydrolase family protein [Thermoclostridium stercorarium]ANW97764.1 amidohydrolase [Thermoclostridium stercorarium subsp. thermolacticum DSM 2910]ANX00291.1 amidohydrolase [Thermoclostridium stercorarium subsp. leptospartum DSM 9219]
MRIIDAHVHVIQNIAGFGAKGELRAIGNGQAIWSTGDIINLIPPELGEYDVTPEAVIKFMDQNNIEKAVLLQGSFYGFQNHYTYQAIQKYPDRFTGAATYDPFCLEKDKIRDYLFNKLGFKIVKFEVSTGSGLMSYHGRIDLGGEIMDEVFSDANERNLVFVIDIGRPGSLSFQVDKLRNAILRYPEMKFVVCHLLAPGLNDEKVVTDELKKLNLPNVWFDLAALPSNVRPEKYPYPTAQQYLKTAKEIVGADRLIFGSDIPSVLTRDSYRNLVDYIMLSDVFTDSEKEKVFFRNAEQVYFGG